MSSGVHLKLSIVMGAGIVIDLGIFFLGTTSISQVQDGMSYGNGVIARSRSCPIFGGDCSRDAVVANPRREKMPADCAACLASA